MNNGTTEAISGVRAAVPPPGNNDELAQTKRELMQAEVKLAKARATVVSAEIDIKTLTARLRALVK